MPLTACECPDQDRSISGVRRQRLPRRICFCDRSRFSTRNLWPLMCLALLGRHPKICRGRARQRVIGRRNQVPRAFLPFSAGHKAEPKSLADFLVAYLLLHGTALCRGFAIAGRTSCPDEQMTRRPIASVLCNMNLLDSSRFFALVLPCFRVLTISALSDIRYESCVVRQFFS